MMYYTLGNTGLKITRLALGTMTFGTEWGWGADKQGAREMFDLYMAYGGNFFDTADVYTDGTSEEWLGKFVNQAKVREEVVIASKYSLNSTPGQPNTGGNARKNMRQAVEQSLSRLNTDYIDLYYLHCWDCLTPAEEVMRTFDDLVTSGKVRYVALSDVPAWYAAHAQTLAQWRGYEQLAALQLEYSLLERNIENEYVNLALELGPALVAWSPLGGGMLSGKYKPSEAREPSTGRLAMMEGTGNPVFDKFSDRNWKIVQVLEEVAKEIGRSMPAVALNWVANRPAVGSVLVGASKPEQLKDNMTALDFEIPEQLRHKLDEVSEPAHPFPYNFFQSHIQSMVTAGTTVADRPESYAPTKQVKGVSQTDSDDS